MTTKLNWGRWSKTSLGVLAFSVMTTAAGAAVSIDSRLPVILVSSMVWCGALALAILWMRRSTAPERSLGKDYASAFEQVAGAAARLAAESESLAARAPSDLVTLAPPDEAPQPAEQAIGENAAGIAGEIAFRTSLLALSAAVEAARPGGGGGAIADEVRLLAQNCATASRRIADLAQESASQARDGETAAEGALQEVRRPVEPARGTAAADDRRGT